MSAVNAWMHYKLRNKVPFTLLFVLLQKKETQKDGNHPFGFLFSAANTA